MIIVPSHQCEIYKKNNNKKKLKNSENFFNNQLQSQLTGNSPNLLEDAFFIIHAYRKIKCTSISGLQQPQLIQKTK